MDSDSVPGANDGFAMIARRYAKPGATAGTIADEFLGTISRLHNRLRSNRVPQPEVDVREVWATVIERHFQPPADAYDPEVIALEYELAVNPVWPMPGAAAVIRELASRSFNLGIVSNAQFYTPLILEALFGSTPEGLGFRTCIWSFETGIAKPSAEIFRRFLDAAEIESPGTVLYVGNDMRNDIAAAQEVGMITALFAGDTRSLRLREDEPISGTVAPDIVLSDLRELHTALSDRTAVAGTAKGTEP